MEKSEYYTGFCTVPNMHTGKTIANTLVEQKLVSCVNIIPHIISIYRWQGKINEDKEHLLIMKTTADKMALILAKIKDLHPYEVPEIIFFPIQAGFPPYLDWIRQSTS